MKKGNSSMILLIAGAALIYFLTIKPATPSVTVDPGIDTTTKRNAIITYWQSNASIDTITTDNGRFVDIITSISPAEINTIYSYVFDYVDKNLTPPPALNSAMQAIQTEYNILTS